MNVPKSPVQAAAQHKIGPAQPNGRAKSKSKLPPPTDFEVRTAETPTRTRTPSPFAKAGAEERERERERERRERERERERAVRRGRDSWNPITRAYPSVESAAAAAAALVSGADELLDHGERADRGHVEEEGAHGHPVRAPPRLRP